MNKLISRPFQIIPRSVAFYIIGWILWVTTLWFLSSRSPSAQHIPTIPHLDKVLHFGYFSGGAGLIVGAFKSSNRKLHPIIILCSAFILGATIGALDEYHQSFVPGRFGNDPWDFLADCLGSIAGASVMLWGWSKYKKLDN